MDNEINVIANPAGSVWHRWDPHIHMPGTLKNDNFSGEDVVEDYINLLNEATPPIRAIGITDYYVLDSYEKLLALKLEGKLPHVELLFPNIELRFLVNAGKGSPINVHLVVCPDDPDHVNKTKRFLGNLKFDYGGEQYGCTNDELIRLGYAFNPNAENDIHALKLGVEQSKVTPENLRMAFKNSGWARENIMVAVAASKNDGTAQLQDSGLKALREELQRLCQIIFSSRPSDQDYWCGKGADTLEHITQTYGGPKPCLHGCDAHEMKDVGKPKEDRYCWIRGDLTFETLRQICYDPQHRVCIGKEPPEGGRPSDTIVNVNIQKADWMCTPKIPINPGLVAIIGARGSGKTALVEMIAAGAKSVDRNHTKRSFLERASEYLNDTVSVLIWGDNEQTSSSVCIRNLYDSDDPRVRYLSQQFVDQLCSSDGLADELVFEIERVIFDAHAPDERLGARSFDELREFRTQSIQNRMEKYREALSEIGAELSMQDDLRRGLDELKRKRKAENDAIERMKGDRKKLTPTDNKGLLDRLDKVRAAAEKKSHMIAKLEKKELKLVALQEETKQFRENDSEVQLEQLKFRYAETELTAEQWKTFTLSYDGDVEGLLDTQLTQVRKSIKVHKGPGTTEISENPNKTQAKPYFGGKIELRNLTHSLLLKEQRRLEACIGVSDDRRKKYNDLSAKIVRAETGLKQRDEEIKKSEAAPEKIEEFRKSREATYRNLVNLIDKEAEILRELYKPLQDRLKSQKGTLGKLKFSVKRRVDIDAWAEAGERLIDKSRSGRFKGVGTLTHIIKEKLSSVWAKGNFDEIANAMSEFRSEYRSDFWKHAFEDAMKSREAKKHWSDQISAWLYGTDHVEVSYGLEYESVDIQQLSPGTRGIVLLLLYLSIDVDDERPLIIDQPEENLDPESVFCELVDCFKEAKTRRQIIIVTHNANLVVNTDADQVIIASRGEHKPKSLPDISYRSGGLENPDIREAVCKILEGGEDAFRERARRLRIF